MHSLRRSKLRHLLEVKFGGDRGRFLERSDLSKGRLSQLLDENQPFGDVAARRLEERLCLPEGYFDTMDAQTLKWAVAFDALPPNLKAQWQSIVDAIGKPGEPPAT